MSKRKNSYFKYLNSEHWKQLRIAAFTRDGFKCTQCGSLKQLRGHHKRYAKDLTKVPVSWIQTLCEVCHVRLHKQKTKERRERRKQRRSMSHIAYLICAFGDK